MRPTSNQASRPSAARGNAPSGCSKAASYTPYMRRVAALPTAHVTWMANAHKHAPCPSRHRTALTAHAHEAACVVVGGGWAGLGAAQALSKAGVNRVLVLDSAANAGGLAATSTIINRTVEPGIKGFWSQYRNIDRLVHELQLTSTPFTDWTSSSFYSPSGLQVTAPIFGSYPRLPAPLGSFFYTLPAFTQLPLADRLTAFPLTPHLLAYHTSQENYSRYDSMSAAELFQLAGVSQRLVDDFLDPILQVVLFAPASQLSAAASLDALYYFALAHQQDFDVRWCRGPVGKRLLQPFADQLERQGVRFQYNRRLSSVQAGNDSGTYKIAVSDPDGNTEELTARSIVFAVGINAMKRVVEASQLLSQQPLFSGFRHLSTLDVMAVRLWLDRKVEPRTPSNVMIGFDKGVGATFFDLNTLQDEYKDEVNSVLEVDFYGATPLMSTSDEVLIQRILKQYLATANPLYAQAGVLDSCVQRFKGGVSAFSPGSSQWMPTVQTPLRGVYMAGDWVRQGVGSHGAKGLCQEKALATGYQAGNAAALHLGHKPALSVLEPKADEPHISFAKQLVGAGQAVLGPTLLPVTRAGHPRL